MITQQRPLPIALALATILLGGVTPLLAQGGEQTVRLRGREARLARRGQELQQAGERLALVALAPWATLADLTADPQVDTAVEAVTPVGRGRWLIRVSAPEQWVTLEALPQVVGVAPIGALDRLGLALRAALRQGTAPDFARTGAGDWQLLLKLLDPSVDEQPVRAFVRERGGCCPEAGLRYSGLLLVEVAPGDVETLATLPQVTAVELAGAPSGECNLQAQIMSEVNVIQGAPYGLDGNGVNIGVMDTGEVGSHGDFRNRFTNVCSGSVSNHTTHVAGTLIGDGKGDASAEGMAPDAEVYAYSWHDPDPAAQMDAAVASHGVVAFNNSWGMLVGWYLSGGWVWGADRSRFGEYTAAESQAIDLTAHSNPTLTIVWAAGNDRFDGPVGDRDGTVAPDGERYDCIQPWAGAKNILSVGALQDSGDGQVPTYFSSFGPTNDGRVKPELMANGWGLWSTKPSKQAPYANWTGTSMSSPVVAGGIADMVQLHRSIGGGGDPRSDLVRALLATTADDLHFVGPDARTGFGRFNARRAADLMQRHFRSDLEHFLQDTIATGQTVDTPFQVPAGMGELRVSLCWIDPPGNPAAADAIINDLDLVLVAPGGGTLHRPWRLDPANPHLAATRGLNTVDTLEQVLVQDPTPGTWTLRVLGSSVSGSQAYAVVSSADLQSSASRRLLGGQIVHCGQPVGGLPVRLTGTLTDQVVTASDGSYVFEVVPGTYTVEPGSEYLLFAPASAAVTVGALDSLANDFVASTAGPLTGQYRLLRDEEPNLPIPDDNPGGVVSTLLVTSDFIISDLQVRVWLNHDLRGDLQIELRAPGGTPSAQLEVADPGDYGRNLYYVFDTELSPIPATALDAFTGIGSAGTWELAIVDSVAGHTGTLEEWELLLSGPVTGAPAVTTSTLPDATQGTPYSQTLQASGGTAPYLWSLVGGSLPAGLSLGASGDLAGTATVSGTFPITVVVEDAMGLCDEEQLSLVVLSSGPAMSGLCGDCDNSGMVNILDALQAARVDSGLATLIPGTYEQCNTQGGSGSPISVLDGLQIARYVVGLLGGSLACSP